MVTASGFLHLFDAMSKCSAGSKAHSSLALHDATIEAADGGSTAPHTIQVRYAARGGLFSSPTVFTYKADNSDQQAEWVEHMRRFAHGPAPRPSSPISPSAAAAAPAAKSPVAGSSRPQSPSAAAVHAPQSAAASNASAEAAHQ